MKSVDLEMNLVHVDIWELYTCMGYIWYGSGDAYSTIDQV